MKKTDIVIICDLSDVLIHGLEGAEVKIAERLNRSVEEIASQMFAYNYTAMWYGDVEEQTFFEEYVKVLKWDIAPQELIGLIHDNFKLISGTVPIYRALHDLYTTVLYTVNSPEWLAAMRDVFDFSDLFDDTIYSYVVRSHKKEVKGFEYIKDKHPASKYYIIDDSTSNIRQAATLGIQGIKFIEPDDLVNKLKELQLL